MRCGCLECGAFMVHAEDKDICVCPDCGWRCEACLGTNTVVSREQLKNLVFTDHTAEHEAQEESGDVDSMRRQPLRPEDFID